MPSAESLTELEKEQEFSGSCTSEKSLDQRVDAISRKVDWHILPLIALLYLCSFL
jgi:hypothetical protein